MPIAAYPWHELARVSPRETSAFAAAHRIHGGASPARIAAALSELCGHTVTIAVRRRALVAAARLDLGARGVVVALERGGATLAIELEAELALAAVAAIAGGKGAPKIAKARAVDAEVAGAAAGILLHLARACSHDDWSLAGVGEGAEATRSRLAGAEVGTIDVPVPICA